MTDQEKREAARQFAIKWKGKGLEKQHDQSFWIELLQNVLGLENATERIEFQKPVFSSDGTKNWIDAYIPETRVLIEQKTLGVPLDKPQAGHGGKTPYQQAKDYADNLPYDEKPRWVVISDFAEIWIYDMNQDKPWENIIIIPVSDLQTKYPLLSFLYRDNVKKITEEMELSLKAGELVGKIHDRFLEQYHDPMAKKTQNSLNILCVRLVFCLYAEDAGLFGEKDSFKKYIEQYEPKDIRQALITLFEVLNTPKEERAALYLSDELDAFPYVNGGLFERKHIEIPKITDEIKKVLIESALFDWSKISPTIFGAVFESTLNPETRRKGGMHYTSIENIHKVIDPLFLDDLKAEFESIKLKDGGAKTRALNIFQNKLAALTFLDPACGSGNFLTETYLSLRRLENEVIRERAKSGQISLGFADSSPIKITIENFYGIEINDFAVVVARTALWIAESQMMKETGTIVYFPFDFLPLKTTAHIEEGNALRLDWKRILSPSVCSYIIGNPPFFGARLMTHEQKKDFDFVFGDKWKKKNDLDYVAGWYKKAAEYISGTNIKVALVSTNSITQGLQPPIIFKKLFLENNIHFDFAHRTFIWDSDANKKAHVHCVIIGFSSFLNPAKKTLFDGTEFKKVDNINAYLVNADNVFIESRRKPICSVPEMVFGSMPNDGGYLSNYSDEDYQSIISKYPDAKSLFRRYLGAHEFIQNKIRWCLWLNENDFKIIKNIPPVLDAIKNTKRLRLDSTRSATKKLAETPYLFGEIRQPKTDYLVIPRHSSKTRTYIPIGYVKSNVICGDANMLIPSPSLYIFGVLESNVHMAWVKAFSGRIKSDYRYSATILYNNFPWPDPTAEQKEAIENAAKNILLVRSKYPDFSLADFYDSTLMLPELIKAHRLNDIAVMNAYGLDIKNTSEADCVAYLMELYKQKTEQ